MRTDPSRAKYDDRHRRVLEQLILHGPLTFEQLQTKAKLRRSDDEFGQVLGDLAERRGCRKPTPKPVEMWPAGETRMYAIKADALARMVKP